MTIEDQNFELRKLLWMYHGHRMLYGDDGCLQCNQCYIDFGLATIEEIQHAFGVVKI
jgi:hypothetical protein